MEWVNTTAERDARSLFDCEPFEILREMPNRLTSRLQTLQGAKERNQEAEYEATLQAFPPLFKGESSEQRMSRSAALDSCWSYLAQSFKDVAEAGNSNIFEQLSSFVFEQHDRLKRENMHSRQRCIPTALAGAGSINPADHAETLPALSQSLRSQGCYTALLGPRELAPEASAAPSINAILQSFSGLDTEADDMLALLAWYQVETQNRAQHTEKRDEMDALLSPLGKMKLKTPAKTPSKRRRGQIEAAQEPPDLASPFGKMVLQTPKENFKTRLRSAATPAKEPPGPALAEAEKGDNLTGPALETRPLVVIVEEAESVDSLALQDMIMNLSENHAELPVILVLGMATSAAALGQMLPIAATDMLATQNFQLVQSLARLEALFGETLLSEDCHLFFGHALLRDMDDYFMLHDFTVRAILQGLQLACVSHFQRQELSFLAALPEDGIEEACGNMSKELRARTNEALKLSPRSKAAGRMLAEVLVGAAKWKLALLWINAAAHAVSYTGLTGGLSLRELYRDGSAPNFSQSTTGKQLCQSLKSRIGSLDEARSQVLLERLLAVAKGRQGAADLLYQEVCSAKAVLESSKVFAASDDSQLDSKKPSGQEAAHNGTRRRLLTGSTQSPRKEQRDHKSLAGQVLRMVQLAFEIMDAPPCTLPGAAPFWVRDERKRRATLLCDPRGLMDQALSHPEQYLGGEHVGLCSDQNDTANAYTLLTEHGQEVDILDWFRGFCSIYEVASSSKEEASPTKKPRKARAKRGSRKVLQNDAADTAAALSSRDKLQQGKEKVQKADEPHPDEQLPSFSIPHEELVARFTQATNELQLMGLVKVDPKRKRGSFAKRLAWRPPCAS